MARFHGGGFELSGYYDFSGTGSPLPPPKLFDKLLHEMISRRLYAERPDHNYGQYRERVSELLAAYSVGPEELVPVSGTTDALRLTYLVFRPEVVLAIEPCSGEHRELSKMFGAKYLPITYNFEESVCDVELRKVESVALSHGEMMGLVIISNPSNPTGCMFEGKLIEALLEVIPRSWVIFVNEAFGDFLEYWYSALSLTDERVVVARSFGKTLGIQGLRAGYVVARSKDIARKYDTLRDPWPISTLAAKLIERLIEEQGLSGYRAFIERSKRSAESEKKYLRKVLSRASYKLYPSVAPYLLVEHPWIKHPQIDSKLEKYRVRVRDASTYYGLNGSFSRIAVKTRSKNRILAQALRYVAAEAGVQVYG